jgi:hypothetical protein
MAIARKPKHQTQPEQAVDVDALIRKGGSVAGQESAEPRQEGEGKPSPVIVRIPPDLLDRIELARQGRAVKIPRHTWLLEAIVEKLEREKASV